jgi:hypothetical protein
MARARAAAGSVEGLRQVVHTRKLLLRTFVLLLPLLLGASVLLGCIDARGFLAGGLVFLCWFAYLLTDTLIVHVWRRRVQVAWVNGATNLGVLASAVATIRFLPSSTIAGLLRTLPVLSPAADNGLDAPTRTAFATFADRRWIEETTASLLPSGVLGLLGTLAAILALAEANETPIGFHTALSVLAVAFLAQLSLRMVLPRLARRHLVRALRSLPAQRRTEVASLAETLDWSGTPPARRQRLIADLSRICCA